MGDGERGCWATHLLGGSHRVGTVSLGPICNSSSHSAHSVARLCGHGSDGSARRGQCSGRAPCQTCTLRSAHCSCRL